MQSSNSYIPGNASIEEIILAIDNDPNATARERHFFNLVKSRELVDCNGNVVEGLESEVESLKVEISVLKLTIDELNDENKVLKEENEKLKSAQPNATGA